MSSKFGALKKKSKPEEKESDLPKRAHPDYKQITAYVRRKTHAKAVSKLAEENAEKPKGQDRDFSELVEDLLAKWLNT